MTPDYVAAAVLVMALGAACIFLADVLDARSK